VKKCLYEEAQGDQNTVQSPVAYDADAHEQHEEYVPLHPQIQDLEMTSDEEGEKEEEVEKKDEKEEEKRDAAGNSELEDNNSSTSKLFPKISAPGRMQKFLSPWTSKSSKPKKNWRLSKQSAHNNVVPLSQL
jgi:hypothetical protein